MRTKAEYCQKIMPIAIEEKIDTLAEKYKVSSPVMKWIVCFESKFKTNAVGDTKIYSKTGQQIYSRGLVQISRYYHPYVTDKQAFDVDYSLEFLAKHLSQGRCSWWTVCRELKKKLQVPSSFPIINSRLSKN